MKSEPSKKAQIIEPVLRHAPPRRTAPQTTAAYLRTAKAEPDALNSKHPKLDHSAAAPQPSQPSRNSPEERQQNLYKQQIQDALREASPDSRADPNTAQQPSQKKQPTSRLAPRQYRPPSPALQDMSDRCIDFALVTLTHCSVHAHLVITYFLSQATGTID